VECQGPQAPKEMIIEHRCGLRITIGSLEHVQWAGTLISKLSKGRTC
jgi:hypothetical protein